MEELTEWFDDKPYPGPEVNPDPWEVLVDTFRAIYEGAARAAQAYVDTVTPAFKAIGDLYESMHNSAFFGTQDDYILAGGRRRQEPRTVVDRDKPAHLARRNSHGPYEGNGYSRGGRKRY